MTIEAVLFTRLSTFAGLTALVGTRIYPSVAPQNVTAPFVTYRRISAVRRSGFGQDIGIVSARFQLDAIALTYSSMRAVVEQIVLALQRWRSDLTNPAVIETFIENEYEIYEDEPDLYHGAVDVIVHYRE